MSTPGYLVSADTRKALQELLDASPGSTAGMRPITHASRQISFVKVTGAESGGRYPGTVQARSEAEGWIDYTTSAYVYPANSGQTLTSGTRYAALRTGDDADGHPQFVALAAGGGSGGCGLWQEVVTGVSCSGGTLTVTTGWVEVCDFSETDPT